MRNYIPALDPHAAPDAKLQELTIGHVAEVAAGPEDADDKDEDADDDDDDDDEFDEDEDEDTDDTEESEEPA